MATGFLRVWCFIAVQILMLFAMAVVTAYWAIILLIIYRVVERTTLI